MPHCPLTSRSREKRPASTSYELRDTDRAFEWFERAYQGPDPKLMNLKVNPQWDGLRLGPRFVDLRRRMWLWP